jgi:hypothetical protein
MQPGIFREANPVVAKNTTTKTTSTKTVAGIQPKLLNSNILSNINSFIKAKNSRTSLFVMEDYAHSPNLYVGYGLDTSFNQNLNDSKIFDTTISLHANQLTKQIPNKKITIGVQQNCLLGKLIQVNKQRESFTNLKTLIQQKISNDCLLL